MIAPTERQAFALFDKTLAHIADNAPNLLIKSGKKRPTKSTIQLRNGSKVIARPVGNTGDAVRGFTGDVLIVDEASRMPDLMWAAAKPTLLTTSGQIWMCSTPHGKQGYFYDCYLNKFNRWSVFHVNSWDVVHEREINQTWKEQQRKGAIEFLKQERDDMSELQFAQEYLGQFIDDLRQLFPDILIRACQTHKRGEIRKGRDYYMGVDVARMGDDDSTFEIIEKLPNKLLHVENQVTSKTLLTDTAKHIVDLDRRYEFEKIYIDDEGIGIAVFDILISLEQTRRKTEALRNSKKIIDWRKSRGSKVAGRKRMMKEDLYFNLLRLMEQGRIQLLDDNDVFQSLKSVQYEISVDKTGRNFTHIFGNYTHITEGLIRAAWCDKEKNLNVWLSSIKV